MLQCIFLLSDSGEVMLEKQLTGHRVDRSICSWFWEHSLSQGLDDMSKLPPVIASPTHYLFQILREGITFLACTQVEMPPLMAIEFLSRVADVLKEYLGDLNEDSIKDNFVIVYELLDEMIDNGFPLTTEPNILREMITPPSMVSKVLSVMTGNNSNVSNTHPGATSSSVPWRTMDPKHSSNEVYVELVEEMDAIISRDGMLVKCEIYGEVQVNSKLSGLPDLTLSFANPSILNDVRFHPCVRFRPWESHQILSFVPPDGLFKLMSYRVNKLKNTPIYVKPQLSSDAGTCRLSVLVGTRNDPGKTIDSIEVNFRLPPCVASADLASNHGTVNIHTDKTCSWSIGRIPKDKAPCMSGTLVLDKGLECLHVFPTFQVAFKITGVALSGLQIGKLDLTNLPNPPHKGFRALTRAGKYEVRS
ncbi:Ap-3 complex subunit mu [Thalictrum thalictroides]|uniref:Ap-3 complex subunit mu n=1 Tax=Thalictrum thalictroides TaxID=46969 RepID=A0A7J6X956_THATH|nr:Ap-3 complex subunit mu [Thalictrum thalictroides]